MAQGKALEMLGIKDTNNGTIFGGTICYSDDAAWEAYLRDDTMGTTVADLKAMGWACVRVSVTEIKRKRGGK